MPLGEGVLGLADRLSPAEHRKTLLQLELFHADFLRKDLRELLMQKPEFIKIHAFQIYFTHGVLVNVRVGIMVGAAWMATHVRRQKAA